MTHSTTRDVVARFTAAQQARDLDALDALLADDFVLVGPLGFVLDKSQWIGQFRGNLSLTSLVINDVQARYYGAVAVVVGVQEQAGRYGDRPVDGRFRISLVVFNGTVAGMHLSPIAAPPVP